MIDDVQLQQAVLAELNWDPSVPAGRIGVTANGGVVTLTGHAGSYAAKYATERAVARVEGVKAIAEEIEVRLEDRFERGDEAIASAVVERMSWDTLIPKDAIQAQVEDGWISLRGGVRWHFQKEAAEAAVRTLAGVVGVINHVTVTPRVDVRDVANDIRAALHRSRFFDRDTIRVAVDGGIVRLTGSVDSLHDRKVAGETAWGRPWRRAGREHARNRLMAAGSRGHREGHVGDRIGWLRAAVLGANDASVSTASLIIGVAAASARTMDIVVAGTAGLVAGAMSMAAGEYVSVSAAGGYRTGRHRPRAMRARGRSGW